MSYKHFNIYDRICIEEYLRKDYSINKMASLMKISKSSISEEIKKHTIPHIGYIARIAQEMANKIRKKSKSKNKINDKLKKYIIEKLKETWSPEQISNRLKIDFPDDETMRISFKKIYLMIYNGELGGITKKDLRKKGRKYKNKDSKREKIKNATPMSERPEGIDKRENIGDWEIDTVRGKQGTKPCLATFADRKTRYYVAVLMEIMEVNLHYIKIYLKALMVQKYILQPLTHHGKNQQMKIRMDYLENFFQKAPHLKI